MYPIRQALLNLNGIIRCGCSIGNKKLLSSIRDCSSAPSKEKWDLMGGLVVERRPVIIKELEEIEKNVSALLRQIEFEKSLKSDHEVNDESERKQVELMKKGDLQNVDLDITIKQTVQDFKDKCKEELAKFKFASRNTEDDKSNNLKSLDRCLDSHLLLLINRKLGDKSYWIVPHCLHQEGEGLHETALRALKENCGDKLNVQMLGRVPWGFYKYKYPENLQSSGSVGAKIFFFKATYLSGQVQLVPEKSKDFKWIETKDILDVEPSAYSNSIGQFLLCLR